MRILHTADWHLGKRLEFYNRYEEQKAVLDEICTIAEEEKVDLVIVAGDLFDAFNPPNEAAELLYKTLKRLAQNGRVPVIAIAGNHDSPDRVNVADILARECGIIFIGRPTDTVPLFALENGFQIHKTEPGFIEMQLPNLNYPVRIVHTAFANEIRLKEYFGENKQSSLQESLAQKWKHLADAFCDSKGVNLLTTHLFMMKRGASVPDEPDGEKPLNIGNADVVYSDAIPSQIQYTALGHLHKYQDIGDSQPVIYSGSPLNYSFSEAGQSKYIMIADVEPGMPAAVQKILLKSGRPLARKTFEEVDEAEQWLLSNKDCLVELTLKTTEFLKTGDRKRIMQCHDGIIYLIPKVQNPHTAQTGRVAIDLSLNEENLFIQYFKSKNSGQAPNEEIMKLFKEIQSL